MLIAGDHGNSSIKTVNYSFVSGLAQHSVRPPVAEEIIEYEGSFWTLTGQRFPYCRDKTRDDRFFILTLFGIAKEILRTGEYRRAERIDLAVGLPPEHYGILKDKFSQYFKRSESIHFVYNDMPFTIMIGKVFVYPQAYAAIAQQKGQLNHHLRLFLIDIGGYTTDVLLLKNGRPDMQFCRSLETGVITITTTVMPGWMVSIKRSVPTMVTTPVKNCVKPIKRPSANWSTSVIMRLTTSPRLFVSK